MKSRERVKRAIHFEKPDRVPISHAILPATQFKYGEALDEILAQVHEDFGWQLLPDTRQEDLPPMYRKGKNYDAFGTLWQVETDGLCGVPVEFPLENWENYDRYQWPEPEADSPRTRLYSGQMAGYNEEYYARGGWITFFERLQQLRGMENLLTDIALKTREIYRLYEDLLEYNLRWLDRLLDKEFDGLQFADDWGTQNTLIIDPQLWRDFFKPAYKIMFEKVKNKGLDIHFHSDGYITDIIPDLLDMGVDVLNCQTTIMGVEKVGRAFAGKICFRTDLDSQKILPFGTPQQVRKHILHVFEHLGTADGGIIACAEIGPDVPLQNIRMLYKTFMEYVY